MGLSHSPSLVMNGLTLCLDAANTKSILSAVEVLVVAGGGGGGGSTAGGGGGGGVLYSSAVSITPGSAITATVGDGGAGTVRSDQGAPTNTSGGNSVFGALTAIGGGRGYSGSDTYTPRTSAVGGSGGGGGYYGGGLDPKGSGTSSAGTAGQGFAGGDGAAIGEWGGGGGGGAGGAGGAQVSDNTLRTGGPGLGFNISGTFQYYGGGGGGGAFTSGFSLGGIGGGGNGGDGQTYTPTAGTTNTGGGGGGGGYYQFGPGGAAGGSGIVIVRYPGPQKAIGGTITSNNGYTIHTFTTVGSTTFTPLVATNNSAVLGLSDLSGRGNFGTTANSPTYSNSNGGSIVFDGTDDYATISGSGGWGFGGNGTIEQWVYVNGNDGVNNRFWCVNNNSSSIDAYLNGSTYNIGFHGGVVLTTTTIPQGSWVHFVVTYTSGTIKVYFNTIEQGLTGTTTGYNITNNGTLNLGSFIVPGYELNGRISSMKIYNRALSAAEVSQNFNATRGRFGI